jgi:hypothetical protein
MAESRICEECDNEIVGGISTATVCRGKWVDGKYIRSECDKAKRRKRKSATKHLYRGGGKYCAYKLKDWDGLRNICLKCGCTFNAASATNRICYDCGLKNDELIGREVKLCL